MSKVTRSVDKCQGERRKTLQFESGSCIILRIFLQWIRLSGEYNACKGVIKVEDVKKGSNEEFGFHRRSCLNIDAGHIISDLSIVKVYLFSLNNRNFPFLVSRNKLLWLSLAVALLFSTIANRNSFINLVWRLNENKVLKINLTHSYVYRNLLRKIVVHKSRLGQGIRSHRKRTLSVTSLTKSLR